MNVLEVIQSATGYLDKHGVESPRLSAEHLLARALGMKRLDLYMCFDRPLSDAERAPLREAVRQRAAGVPLQHLLGTWDFYGRTFKCDSRALIPRPETELLAEWILETQLPPDRDLRLLDVGTGTGILAITAALERPLWKVTATDISVQALALARENLSLLAGTSTAPVAVNFLEADLIPAGTSWDVVVSNPPYIATEEVATLPREVRHDPLLALDGGADGLAIYRRLVPMAFECLSAGGYLFLEIGAGQDSDIVGICESAGFSEVGIRRDFNHLPRCVRAQKT